MKIEIIIPVRNCPSRVFRLLAELQNQLRQVNAVTTEVGVCIVDDASTDETGETVKGFVDGRRAGGEEWWRFIHLHERRNAGGARNAAARTSNAPWLAFFDADDTITPDALQTLLGAFTGLIDEDVIVWGYVKKTKQGDSMWSPSFENCKTDIIKAPVGPWVKAVRRDKFVPFPEGVFCEDCPWWFAQADKLTKAKIIPEAIYVYDRRDNCFSATLETFSRHPRTLEDLAYNNVLVEQGLNDRAPSDCLRNLALMYDLRNKLRKPEVREAWAKRFHTEYLNILSGRWSF